MYNVITSIFIKPKTHLINKDTIWSTKVPYASWFRTRIFAALITALLTVSNTAFAQGQGSWGGATGIVQFVLIVVGILFLLWVVFVNFLLRSMSVSSSMRFILVPIIAFSPIAFFAVKSKLDSKKWRVEAEAKVRRDQEMVVLRNSLRLQAEEYMTQKCQTERKATKSVSIPAESGLLIAGNLGRAPEIPNLPHQPDVKEIERLTKEYKIEDVQRMQYANQFLKPLNWTDQKDANDEHLLMGARFVEKWDSNSKVLRRASWDWWRVNLESNEWVTFNQYWTVATLKPSDVRWLYYKEPRAKYIVEYRDISTKEDRANWVGRGRIRLIDLPTEKLVAEYVGFSSMPWLGYDDVNWRNKTATCSGVETNYLNDSKWNAVNFFFTEVVQIK